MDDHMKSLMELFITYLKTKGTLSVNTLESYIRDVQQYTEFLHDKGIEEIRRAPYHIFTDFIELQKEKGRAPTTINRSMASVRAFYRFLLMEEYIKVNPTIGVVSPKIIKKAGGVLTKEEVARLLDQPERMGLKGIRDKGMLELVYASGIRVNEMIELNIDDFDEKNRILKCGEKGSERFLPLNTSCIKPMMDYIEMGRPFMLRDRNEKALFVNTNGGRLSRQGFWKIIKQYAIDAGIDRDITPHALRQALAVHMLQDGRSEEDVKVFFGRSDLTSLQEYVLGEK